METRKSFPEDRSDIRRIHKELRAAMTEEMVLAKSRNICERLLEAEWYRSSTVIYGYYPLGKEVDCLGFLERALKDGKRVALPRMLSFSGDRILKGQECVGGPSLEKSGAGRECHMDFYEITSLKQVEEGGFHVMEPTEECPVIQEKDAVVLVPGVVFDRNGNRYGYGKGYYDRYFARFPQLYKAALAYENQMEPELAALDTDVKMDCIYTECGVYKQ